MDGTIEIFDHQGYPMLILPEVAQMLDLNPGDRLQSFEMFWNVIQSNSTACIAFARGLTTIQGPGDMEATLDPANFTDPRPSNVNIPVLQP